MKKSIFTVMATAAMVTVFLSGISSAGPKMSFKQSYKSSGITKKFKRPTLVPYAPKPMQLTLASAIAKCNKKYPGFGVNKAVLKNGQWLCIVGDMPVGTL
jgi:hypothetical protein